MTQEELLDLAEEYAYQSTRAAMEAALSSVGERAREAHQRARAAHMALLDAVRSLPIEAGR